MIMASIGELLRLALEGRDNKRAGKIGAQGRKEEKFALGINVRELGEIVAQSALRAEG